MFIPQKTTRPQLHLKLQDKYNYEKTKEKCPSTEKIYKHYNESPVKHNLGNPSRPVVVVVAAVQSKSCPALCDPVGCSTPVLHDLLETVLLVITLDPNKPGNLQDSNGKNTSVILTSDRKGTS